MVAFPLQSRLQLRQLRRIEAAEVLLVLPVRLKGRRHRLPEMRQLVLAELHIPLQPLIQSIARHIRRTDVGRAEARRAVKNIALRMQTRAARVIADAHFRVGQAAELGNRLGLRRPDVGRRRHAETRPSARCRRRRQDFQRRLQRHHPREANERHQPVCAIAGAQLLHQLVEQRRRKLRARQQSRDTQWRLRHHLGKLRGASHPRRAIPVSPQPQQTRRARLRLAFGRALRGGTGPSRLRTLDQRRQQLLVQQRAKIILPQLRAQRRQHALRRQLAAALAQIVEDLRTQVRRKRMQQLLAFRRLAVHRLPPLRIQMLESCLTGFRQQQIIKTFVKRSAVIRHDPRIPGGRRMSTLISKMSDRGGGIRYSGRQRSPKRCFLFCYHFSCTTSLADNDEISDLRRPRTSSLQ